MLERTYLIILVILSFLFSSVVEAKSYEGKTDVLLRYVSVWSPNGNPIKNNSAVLKCESAFVQTYHLNPQLAAVDFKSTYHVDMRTRMMSATADIIGQHFDLNTLGTSPSYDDPIQFRYDDNQNHIAYSVKLSDQSVVASIDIRLIQDNYTCTLSNVAS